MDYTNTFLEKYEAHARLSERQYARRTPMSVTDYHKYHTAMDVYEYESYIQREPYIEVAIPQHKFQELVEENRLAERLYKDLDHATNLMKQQAQDRLVRLQNPAVMKAFEKYQMLLELARK